MDAQVKLKCDKCTTDNEQTIKLEGHLFPEENTSKDEGQGIWFDFACKVCKNRFYGSFGESRSGLIFFDNSGLTPDATISYVKPEILSFWKGDINESSLAFLTFIVEIENVTDFCKVKFPVDRLRYAYERMIFVQIITAVETYLQDTIISEVFSNQEALGKLLREDKDLKAKKVDLIELLTRENILEDIVRDYLTSISYHNLPRVDFLLKVLFGCGLDFGSKEDKDLFYKAIHDRHDCVHRNGRSAYGIPVSLSIEYIMKISKLAVTAVSNMEMSLIALAKTKAKTRRACYFPETNAEYISDFEDDIPF